MGIGYQHAGVHLSLTEVSMIIATVIEDKDEQLVRIPAEFRISSKEVIIRKNPRTGEITLSPRLTGRQLVDLLQSMNLPEDFLSPEERNQAMPREREEL
jgi:antitoxin VapB